MNDAEVVQACQSAIEKGSKTFHFASRFFGREKMQDVALLYAWCRHCDDAIDESESADRSQVLFDLKNQTKAALGGDPNVSLPFRAVAHLAEKHNIPRAYVFDLLQGMAMDALHQIPANKSELYTYGYHVAGVVGLMMSHIMGVSDEQALRHACHLGTAMQLTNIARDVMADQQMGRCYLPLDLLEQHGLSESTYHLMENRQALSQATCEMLKWADDLYVSGQQGVQYLDALSALVILIASRTYAEIGMKVRSAGPRAWDQRLYTTRFEKLKCLALAIFDWTRTWITRPLAWIRHRPVAIQSVWRPL
ncbi:MAG: phytoene/squalene synthase family protein [Bdellovibrionales bacterium]